MTVETANQEAAKRFHLALSFVRWYMPDGTPREKPPNIKAIIALFLKKDTLSRPEKYNDVKDAIFRNKLTSRRATLFTNRLREQGLLPEPLVQLFETGRWTASSRAETAKPAEDFVLQEYPKAYQDYLSWKNEPDTYLNYVDATAAHFASVRAGARRFDANQTGFGGVLVSGHPTQKTMVATTTAEREKD